MPINLNRLEIGGLAALANNQIPNLNLPVNPVQPGLFQTAQVDAQNKSDQIGAVLAQIQQKYSSDEIQKAIEMYKQEQTNKRLQYTEQGLNERAALNRASNEKIAEGYQGVTQRGQNLNAMKDQKQLALDMKKFDLDTWYKGNQISQKDQELFQKHVQTDFENKLKLDDQKLKHMDLIFGGYLATAMQSQDPSQLKEAQEIAVGQALTSGIIDPKTAEALLKLNPKQMAVYANMQSNLGGKALVAKQMGFHMETNPDGTMTFSQGLTSSSQSETQKDYKSAIKSYMDLENTKAKFKEVYLTTKGRQDLAASKIADEMGSYPVLGSAIQTGVDWFTGKTPEQQKEFITGSTKFLIPLEQFFNDYRVEITGAAAALAELDRLKTAVVNKDMGPTEFMAAVEELLDKRLRSEPFYQKLLKSGLSVKDSNMKSTPTEPKILRVREIATGKIGDLPEDEMSDQYEIVSKPR